MCAVDLPTETKQVNILFPNNFNFDTIEPTFFHLFQFFIGKINFIVINSFIISDGTFRQHYTNKCH